MRVTKDVASATGKPNGLKGAPMGRLPHQHWLNVIDVNRGGVFFRYPPLRRADAAASLTRPRMWFCHAHADKTPTGALERSKVVCPGMIFALASLAAVDPVILRVADASAKFAPRTHGY
jgi:hypothetical protein